MIRGTIVQSVLAAVAATLSFCACTSTPPVEIQWSPVVCYAARGAIERVRCGRPDAADPRLQAVSVDQVGDVALMHFDGGAPRSEVLYRNGSEFTGLVVADLDPATPGTEIYASGYAGGTGREGTGGLVVQIVVQAAPTERARVRRIYEGAAYVHSVEPVEPQRGGDAARLLVSTYAGEVHLLTPTTGAGPWDDRLLYREPPTQDIEARKIKDVGFLKDVAGRPRHEALLALKGGRVLFLDLDHPEATRLVHEELGGVSRVTPDPDGGAYITGYQGRLLHFVRAADGFRVDVLAQAGKDSGLRGVVLGEFPVTGAVSHLVIFGSDKLCRALVPRQGALDPRTLYVDLDRGHTLEAADIVPGNGADELLIGGYSNRVTMLVARRARSGTAR